MFRIFLPASKILLAALEQTAFVLFCCSAAARANLTAGARPHPAAESAPNPCGEVILDGNGVETNGGESDGILARARQIRDLQGRGPP